MYVAKALVAGTPQAEVIGQTLLTFTDHLEADSIAHLLTKYELEKLDPEKWYPHQNWLNLLRDLIAELGDGASYALVSLGRNAVEKVVMPPEMQTIPDILNALQSIHHLNFRNVPTEEGYPIRKVAEQHYIIYNNTPNPDDTIYGFIWGFASRFKKEEESFNVTLIDNDRPDIARSAFELIWGVGV